MTSKFVDAKWLAEASSSQASKLVKHAGDTLTSSMPSCCWAILSKMPSNFSSSSPIFGSYKMTIKNGAVTRQTLSNVCSCSVPRPVCVVSHTLPGNKPGPANILANSDTVFRLTVESSNQVNKPLRREARRRERRRIF